MLLSWPERAVALGWVDRWTSTSSWESSGPRAWAAYVVERRGGAVTRQCASALNEARVSVFT